MTATTFSGGGTCSIEAAGASRTAMHADNILAAMNENDLGRCVAQMASDDLKLPSLKVANAEGAQGVPITVQGASQGAGTRTI